MFAKTKAAIKNGQSLDTCNTGQEDKQTKTHHRKLK